MSKETLALNEDTDVVHIDQGAIGAIVKSEVEAQLDAAHRYPRQLKKFLNEAITLATFSVEIAESCMYSLPRAGKTITGPSIRLAEMIASAYGNLHVGARVVGVEEKEIIAQGVAWDLEKNVRVTMEKRRRITKKDGRRFDDDMIVVTGNAAASIGLRDAIFRVIPRAYVTVVYDAARKVAVGDASTLADKRQAVWERLQKMGATPARILAKIGKEAVEDIGLGELEALIGFGVAIKDGGITVDEAFPVIESMSADKGKSAIDRIVEQNKKPSDGQENLKDVKPKDSGKAESTTASTGASKSASSSAVAAEAPHPDTTKHSGVIISDDRGERASCSCGWKGINCVNDKEATRDLQAHYAMVKKVSAASPSGDGAGAGVTRDAQDKHAPAPQVAEDPDARCTEAQFEQLEAAILDHNIERKLWLSWVKTTFELKMVSHLKQSQFARALAWVEAGGRE